MTTFQIATDRHIVTCSRSGCSATAERVAQVRAVVPESTLEDYEHSLTGQETDIYVRLCLPHYEETMAWIADNHTAASNA